MKAIDIQINKTALQYISISYNISEPDQLPDLFAKIELMAGTKKVSSFTIDTNTWNNETKFEFPPELVEPIKQISQILETIATQKCGMAMKELPAPKDINYGS